MFVFSDMTIQALEEAKIAVNYLFDCLIYDARCQDEECEEDEEEYE